MNQDLKPAIQEVVKTFKKFHLDYDQSLYVTKQARKELKLQQNKKVKNKLDRLSQEEQEKFITHAYRQKGKTGLLLKTLLQTGVRVSEFVNIKVGDFFFSERTITIKKGKGSKQRVVPITRELAQELITYLNSRSRGYLFESNRNDKYSVRRIQQIVKKVAKNAGIEKEVYPHLLRHTIATRLLNDGMPLEQVQLFLGHERIENTRIYAKNSAESIRASFDKAMGKL